MVVGKQVLGGLFVYPCFFCRGDDHLNFTRYVLGHFQLQGENIQEFFLKDNFFNLLFSNIFYKKFNKNTPKIDHKRIANALGTIAIPIIEEQKIAKPTARGKDISLLLHADIDTENREFPLAQLNDFLGQLVHQNGVEHDLDFNYLGVYQINTQLGLVTEAKLNYTFEIKELYKKTSTIIFNLQENEQ